MENDEQTRFHRQRREADLDPEFERVNNLTTVFRYPDVPDDMTGPLFIYRNEVSSIDLWLKFVPPELLQKFGMIIKSRILMYGSIRPTKLTRGLRLTYKLMAVDLVQGYFMAFLCSRSVFWGNKTDLH